MSLSTLLMASTSAIVEEIITSATEIVPWSSALAYWGVIQMSSTKIVAWHSNWIVSATVDWLWNLTWWTWVAYWSWYHRQLVVKVWADACAIFGIQWSNEWFRVYTLSWTTLTLEQTWTAQSATDRRNYSTEYISQWSFILTFWDYRDNWDRQQCYRIWTYDSWLKTISLWWVIQHASSWNITSCRVSDTQAAITHLYNWVASIRLWTITGTTIAFTSTTVYDTTSWDVDMTELGSGKFLICWNNWGCKWRIATFNWTDFDLWPIHTLTDWPVSKIRVWKITQSSAIIVWTQSKAVIHINWTTLTISDVVVLNAYEHAEAWNITNGMWFAGYNSWNATYVSIYKN